MQYILDEAIVEKFLWMALTLQKRKKMKYHKLEAPKQLCTFLFDQGAWVSGELGAHM